MDDTDEVVLALRFRGHEPPLDPPDVAAFGTGAAVASVPELHAHPQEIAVLQRGRPLAPRASLTVFFQHASFGIPPIAGLQGSGDVVTVELASWSVRPTVFGYLACVPRERRRSRVAWVIAACLPLALVNEAIAAPPDKGTVQRPKNLRAVDTGAADEPAAVPAPEPEPAAPAIEDDSPFTETAGEEPVASADVPAPPAPRAAFGSDPAIVDAAWDGVDGFEVEIALKGGRRMRGRIGAVQRDTFTLIEFGTGSVLVMPKSGVASLRVRTPREIPSRTGAGLIAGGVVLTSVASPVFISGVAMLAICPSCTYIHVPLLLIGAGMLAGGIPMLVRGVRVRQEYRKALQEHALVPVVSRTSHGWSGGLRFRF